MNPWKVRDKRQICTHLGLARHCAEGHDEQEHLIFGPMGRKRAFRKRIIFLEKRPGNDSATVLHRTELHGCIMQCLGPMVRVACMHSARNVSLVVSYPQFWAAIALVAPTRFSARKTLAAEDCSSAAMPHKVTY